MKLATLAVGTCAALALVATAFEADARGNGRGGSRGKSGAAHHHHHGGHARSRVFIAGGFAAWPRAYYWPGYYAAPAAVMPVAEYWYYCQEHAAYYPYVQECPGGWQPVLPTIPPPEG
jgi:hypothetical protein